MYVDEKSFREIFRSNREIVTKELEKIFLHTGSISKETDKRDLEFSKDILNKMNDFEYLFIVKRPGKRVRPSIMIMTALGNSYENRGELFYLGCAPEILHNATLIHDDIQDKDLKRSNIPTVRKMWAERLEKEGLEKGLAQEKADALGINSGDKLLILPFHIISSSSLDDRIKVSCASILSKSMVKIAEGQTLDLSFPHMMDKISLEDVFYMYEKKTGSLFEACALIGLAVSGGTKEQENHMSEWARKYFNLRFQIKDDFIENNIDGKKGRPIGGDLKEGKVTPLIIETLQRGTEEQKKDLRSVLGKRDAAEGEIQIAIDAMKDSGAVDYLRGLIDEYGENGKELVEKCGFRKESEDFLKDLTEFVGDRNY